MPLSPATANVLDRKKSHVAGTSPMSTPAGRATMNEPVRFDLPLALK